MNIVYLSLGSNQGNRFKYLHQAIEAIGNRIGEVLKESSCYETEPWGFSSSGRFINQAICINSDLTVQQILKEILEIESLLGRTRPKNTEIYSDRVIDIDILFYSNQIHSYKGLIVPHKFIHERRFVLEPLNEIAPDFVHPLYKMTINKLLEKCSDKLKVNRLIPTESIID